MGVTVDALVLSGGLSQGAVFQQTIADATGIPAMICASKEQSALGAALMALAGCKKTSIQDVGLQAVKVAGVIKPVPRDVAVLEERYRVYRALYPRLKEVFRAQTDPII